MKIYIPSYQRCFFADCTTYLTNAAEFKHCGQCRIARYCSPECQKLDWRSIHKESCGKTDSVAKIGSSVAIRPHDLTTSYSSTSYPSNRCKAPANELHGLLTSVSPFEIELFDCDLIPTGSTIKNVASKDIVVTQWNLQEEKNSINEKKERMDEIKKSERRNVENELEKKKDELERKKKREERARKLLNERTKQNGSEANVTSEPVEVDWSLFTDQDLLDIDEDEPS